MTKSLMTPARRQKIHAEYANLDRYSPESILQYAKLLEGLTYRDLLDLDLPVNFELTPINDSPTDKGKLGKIVEERFFGIQNNSRDEPDIIESGIEVKTTPSQWVKNTGKLKIDNGKDKRLQSKERLSLSMIPNDKPLADTLEDSHVFTKMNILLIQHIFEPDTNELDYEIALVDYYTPSGTDLEIMQSDFDTIRTYVQSGRAHELSEGLTTYLGAATKSSSSKDRRTQYYPLQDEEGNYILDAQGNQIRMETKPRAFTFKQGFMKSLTSDGINKSYDSILAKHELQKGQSFESLVLSLIDQHKGKTANEIAIDLGLLQPTKAKNTLSNIVMAMLGVRQKHATEFERSNTIVKTVRTYRDKKGELRMKEDFPLRVFKMLDILHKNWEDSPWYELLSTHRFLIVVFNCQDSKGTEPRLQGAFFWSLPTELLGDPDDTSGKDTVYSYWKIIRSMLEAKTFRFTRKPVMRNGRPEITVQNNFPGSTDHEFFHIRPGATLSAYRISPEYSTDGLSIETGSEKDTDLLPDNQRIVKQKFWFSKHYIVKLIQEHNL